MKVILAVVKQLLKQLKRKPRKHKSATSTGFEVRCSTNWAMTSRWYVMTSFYYSVRAYSIIKFRKCYLKGFSDPWDPLIVFAALCGNSGFLLWCAGLGLFSWHAKRLENKNKNKPMICKNAWNQTVIAKRHEPDWSVLQRNYDKI